MGVGSWVEGVKCQDVRGAGVLVLKGWWNVRVLGVLGC